ncbi:hypothetical protein SU69_05565 [Thermosipho melanesiensis]|uniref:GIY-YIG domain-containing protein n=2 Tax=Thermosipho melanesiensis TaxID=46541 RepID=A6LM00_THEM4|nr:hypothetical protein [Thermosipho melanesiensis]ABR30951.1 hypothetical protein Tmel_1091 [Thermosipho melanesiensis BI429]APT74877.1 hypothetical protein BW47_05830 [Thermosipho melanesiensis]OOC35993.1 hypothetical protein SU68_05625 [Thermosipho melanesiensis]OOC38132.1 hypothetical protein SU69_05565 [Thermosipho melanesiensis]OOC38261.1 hypothetical protein SU70_05575 [Thermosipho melanesiensis]
MGITLWGKSGERYNFDGPYITTNMLQDRSGVYVILCSNRIVIDVGEASMVKTRIESHDRKECWEKHCYGFISYAAYYIEYGKKPSRVEVEQDIREFYNPPCGKR